MTPRRLFLSVLLVIGGVVVAWVWFGRDGVHREFLAKPESAGSKAASGPQTSAKSPTRAIELTSSVTPGAPLVRTESTLPNLIAEESGTAVARLPESEPEGSSELESVRHMISDFRTRMKENPVGSNAEIMRAVMGGNPAGATLGPPVGQSLNSEGELVDRWGIPYFFHQLSKTSTEIRSAGPDRQMWTADDLVTK